MTPYKMQKINNIVTHENDCKYPEWVQYPAKYISVRKHKTQMALFPENHP